MAIVSFPFFLVESWNLQWAGVVVKLLVGWEWVGGVLKMDLPRGEEEK
jgi:hypothetical protein